MEYEDFVKIGLSGEGPLKLILCGDVESTEDGNKVGVVSVVYATLDVNMAKKRMEELTKNNASGAYYMVYSVPFDTDFTSIGHYPSIEIGKEDLV